jgi:hypothetical protein
MSEHDMMVAFHLCPVMRGEVYDIGPETCDICPYGGVPGLRCVKALHKDIAKKLNALKDIKVDVIEEKEK